MVQHTSRIRHPRGGEDNRRALGRVQRTRFGCGLRDTHLRECGNCPLLTKERNRLLVKVLIVLEEHARCLNRKRTVDDDRGVAVEPPRLPEIVEIVEERLCPPDGKRRNDDVPAAIHRVADDLKERRLLVIVAMNTIAVCGLDKQEVRPCNRFGITQNRLVWLTEIARKDELCLLTVLLHHDFKDCRPQNMPRIAEGQPQIVHLQGILIGDGFK